MYIERLKESIHGVVGSFVLKDGKMIQSDLDPDLLYITQSICYLTEMVNERRNISQLAFLGEEKDLFVYFHQDLAAGVLLTHTANIPLLNYFVKRLLERKEDVHLPEPFSSTLEGKVPYFDRPKGEVLPNVPKYARQVLEFVDGKRTIRDIIEQSALPLEVVLDVILSYRRSSVLHYRS